MNKLLDFDKSTLLKLLGLKLLTLLLSALVLLFTYMTIDIELDYQRILLSIGLGLLVLVLWYFRSRLAFSVSEVEVFLLLASDILILSLLIHYSGGSANPFASSLLVPLALATALLTKKLSLAVVVLTLIIYAGWTFGGSGHAHVNHSMFSLHLYGMWVNFLLCAIILFVFITYATDSIKKREYHLQEAREKILRDEQLVAIATLTASTAHALGTPMSTMSIVTEEWEREGRMDAEKALLCEQLDICKKYLARIGDVVKDGHEDVVELHPVEELFGELRNQLLLLRPAEDLSFHLDESLKPFHLKNNRSLLFAMVNLVENAMQSGGDSTCVEFEKQGEELHIVISDSGEGLNPEMKKMLGNAFITSKKGGWGLGAYLSNSTVEKFGGKISMMDRESGGTRTVVVLPLTAGNESLM